MFVGCSLLRASLTVAQAEFNRYKAVLQDEGLIFPKKPSLGAKIDDINALLSRPWTDAEVNEKIVRERNLRQKYSPHERTRLQEALEEAQRRGDDARASELQDQLDSLEVPRLAFKTSLTPTKRSSPSTPTQPDRMAQLNAHARHLNHTNIRQAQIKEKVRVRERIHRGDSVGSDSTQLKSKGDSQWPPSTPINGSGASTPLNGASKGPLLPHIAKIQMQKHQTAMDHKGLPQIHKPIVDDDVIAAMDIEIDVDID